MTRRTMVILAALTAMLSGAMAGEDDLAEQLRPLRPFLGKTWKGRFEGEAGAKPAQDVARWERALNGTAIRILHSINDGEYGGETLLVWDGNEDSLVFYYFTTAGFYTRGTCRIEGGKLISHEKVTGGAGGVTEVKAVAELLPDGKMRTTSQYLKDGAWVDGHGGTYVEDPEARVVFR